ncbi:MAG: hypothetical protein H0V36_00825 [Chloroflexi bacterium]|nr:hypothetical protein [Chloroflexota bacterium]
MLTVLTVLTLLVVAVIVLVLVGYLVATIVYLRRADRNLEQLVGGLQAVQSHAQPLPQYLTTINGALGTLRDDLVATDDHLAVTRRVLGRG